MKSKRRFPVLAALASVLSLALLSAAGYLVFVFPKQIAVMAQEGRTLSKVEQVLVNLSALCSYQSITVFGLLGVMFIGALIWFSNSLTHNETNG